MCSADSMFSIVAGCVVQTGADAARRTGGGGGGSGCGGEGAVGSRVGRGVQQAGQGGGGGGCRPGRDVKTETGAAGRTGAGPVGCTDSCPLRHVKKVAGNVKK